MKLAKIKFKAGQASQSRGIQTDSKSTQVLILHTLHKPPRCRSILFCSNHHYWHNWGKTTQNSIRKFLIHTNNQPFSLIHPGAPAAWSNCQVPSKPGQIFSCPSLASWDRILQRWRSSYTFVELGIWRLCIHFQPTYLRILTVVLSHELFSLMRHYFTLGGQLLHLSPSVRRESVPASLPLHVFLFNTAQSPEFLSLSSE